MKSIQEAVDLAQKYLADVYGNKPEGLAVEEVYSDNQNKNWIITLGFNSKFNSDSNFSSLQNMSAASVAGFYFDKSKEIKREYKCFKIDKQTGDFNGMFIREVDHVI